MLAWILKVNVVVNGGVRSGGKHPDRVVIEPRSSSVSRAGAADARQLREGRRGAEGAGAGGAGRAVRELRRAVREAPPLRRLQAGDVLLGRVPEGGLALPQAHLREARREEPGERRAGPAALAAGHPAFRPVRPFEFGRT